MSAPTQVAHLIDPAIAGEYFRQAGMDVADVHANYVRHKPGETTIIGYTFHTTAGRAELGYAHWCHDQNRADEIWTKASTLKSRVSPLGAATQRLDRHTVFYPFPSDARLRRMRWYTTPRKLKRTQLAELAPHGATISSDASSVEVLRYKPERRVVAAVDVATIDAGSRKFLVRYATRQGAHEMAAIAHGLRTAGVATPEPLAQLEDGRVSIDEFIVGIELRCAVRSQHVLVDDVAAALGRLHRANVAAPKRAAWDDLIAASQGLEGLAAWYPSAAAACDSLRRELARTLPTDSGPEVLLHGDLHANNVMITADGVSFVDLERAARGPAAIDLGRLRGFALGMSGRRPGCSPMAVNHTDRVVDRYRATMDGLGITDSALSWHTAIAIVDQALLVARHLEAGWQADVESLVDLAGRHIHAPGQKTSCEWQRPMSGAAANMTEFDVAGRWTEVFDGSTPEWMASWPRVTPHPTRAWTVSNGVDYGLLDPSSLRCTMPSPADDAHLPALASALRDGDLVAYRHHRRAVVRHNDRFVKVARPERVADLVMRHQSAAAASTYASPLVIGQSDDGRVDLSTLPGISLHESLRRNDSPPISRLARLLADVRATDGSSLPGSSFDDPQRWIEVVARIEPDLRSTLEVVASTLPSVDVSGNAFVHGDLHDKNIIIGPVGQLGVIDLDSASRGAPELDVANLSVHLELRALQSKQPADLGIEQSVRLVAACFDSTDFDLALLDDLRRHTWFRLACLYRCRRAGRHLTAALLTRAV